MAGVRGAFCWGRRQISDFHKWWGASTVAERWQRTVFSRTRQETDVGGGNSLVDITVLRARCALPDRRPRAPFSRGGFHVRCFARWAQFLNQYDSRASQCATCEYRAELDIRTADMKTFPTVR